MAMVLYFVVLMLLVNQMSAAGLRVKKQVDNIDQAIGNDDPHSAGYSGTVVDGKSSYILKFNDGVPVYGGGEPYYFSYTHNFPIATNDFEHLVNSHNLPKKYKFTGSLDVTGLL